MISSSAHPASSYRGRLAPSPTGLLHLGHARTFWKAQSRAQYHNGALIFRNDDLDSIRAKPEFVSAMLEDLRWFGFLWSEGPDCGGTFGPYNQSERHSLYYAALEKLRVTGCIYPCICSRKDLQNAAHAPHAADDESIYPGTCRPANRLVSPGHACNWRFQVADGEIVSFVDGHYGSQEFTAGRDFGDFVVWRHDGIPAYQLATVVDDSAMRITEVVRGADLLLSTARQILLYRALGLPVPAFFYHCPLMNDSHGQRLAKRHDALSLRALRQQGALPETLRRDWC